VSSPITLDQLTFPKASPQATKVLITLSAENPDLNEVDHIIMQDPVLAGTLIRYANSPLYRRGGEISNVPTAIRLLGVKNVRSAMVMTALRATCPSDNDVTHAVMKHSLAIAALCKLIARKSCAASADDLELLGLIHDIGMVVLATNVEETYRKLLSRAQTEHVALDELETAEFGFNHDQIAVKALHEFRLPKRHETVLTHFHQLPDESVMDEGMKKERAVLMLAHRLLAETSEDAQLQETLMEPTDVLASMLGLDEAALADIREQASACIAHGEN
jgi:HD-like signal output (HDOD) protein